MARPGTSEKEDLLCRGGRHREAHPKSADPKAPAPLKVEEAGVGERRCLVCHNEDQAKKDDGADREAIVKSLEDQLQGSDKTLVGNKGYRKFLRGAGKSRFEADYDKAEEDARYDGKWALSAGTKLSA